MGNVNVVGKDGTTLSVPEEQLPSVLAQGFHVEQTGEANARSTQAGFDAAHSGVLDTVKAGAEGFLRTSSLGLTDLAQDPDMLRGLKEAHPTASSVGSTAAMFFAPEGSPASLLSEAGSAIAGGDKLLGAIKAGAFEGAGYGVGDYISDVALGDADLSAEGFVGAMGRGALFGGGAGGAFHLAGDGLVAARKLFSRGAVGDAGAVEAAEAATHQKLTAAADLSTDLRSAAQKQIDAIQLGSIADVTGAAGTVLQVRGEQALQRAHTSQAIDALQGERAAAADLTAGLPPDIASATSVVQRASGNGLPAIDAAHDSIARQSMAADLAADDAHAAVAANANTAVGRASASVSRLRQLSDEVAAREQQVRELLAKNAQPGEAIDALALPATHRADLAAQYDDAITRASASPHRLDAEAAIADAAKLDGQMFDAALEAGGPQAKRAREILAARGEAGVDGSYAAARRLERVGTGAHLPAVDEVSRGMAALGPEALAPPSLEDLLMATKGKVDAGEAIGGMANRSKGRLVNDASEIIEKVGGYEKAVADLSRELGDAAPPEARALQQAYDAAIDASNAGTAKAMATHIDDAAMELPPGRMSKDDVKAYQERLRVKSEAGARASGYRTRYEAQGAGSMVGGQRRSMFTARGVDPIGASGQSLHDVSRALSSEQRSAARELVTKEQATRQLMRSTPMDGLMSGRQTVADMEKLAGRKLGPDEIIEASREMHLGAIDETKESAFRSWWNGERKPVEAATEVAAEAAPSSAPRQEAPRTAADERAAKKAESDDLRKWASDTLDHLQAQSKARAAGGGGRAPGLNGNAASDIRSAYGASAEAGPALGRSHLVDDIANANKEAAKDDRWRNLRGAAGKASGVAAMLDAARSLGMPGIPNISAIPVIGPLLSMALKAKVARSLLRRMGGKVPASIETGIAVRAAETHEAVYRAVDAALGQGAKATRVLERPATRVAGSYGYQRSKAAAETPHDVLSTPLYPGETVASKPKDVREAASARAQELAQAVANPDAVARAVREAVPASNPTVLDAIVQTVQRKLTYLQSKAPAVPLPDPMRQTPPPVSTAEATRFARIVRAVEDPTSVLRDMAAGTMTPDVADALKNVYPRLFAEVTKRVIDQASKPGAAVPYRTRVQLSVLLGADLDPGMKRIASLQDGLPHIPPLGSMGGPGDAGAAPPPPPGIAPNLTALYQTSGDRMAAK